MPSPGGGRELGRPWPRQRHDEIEPVEQRAREPVAIPIELLRRARARRGGIAATAARAEVHRPDELEPRREDAAPADPRHGDRRRPRAAGAAPRAPAAGTRAARRAAARRGARASPRPASDWRRRRRSRRSRRCGAAHETAACGSGRRRLRARLRPSGSSSPRAPPRPRAAAGSPAAGARASSCRSRAARRAAGCDHRRPRSRARGGRAPARARRSGREAEPPGRRSRRPASGSGGSRCAAEVRDRLGEMPHRHRLDARERDLGSRLGRADEPARAVSPRALGRDQRARHGPKPSVEGELARPPRAPRGSPSGIWREAASTASAIGRSKPEPSLRRSAGARLTVIRRSGHSSSAEVIPLRTRSLASWQARSARPTIANPGTPSWRCASTSTRRGSSPTRA